MRYRLITVLIIMYLIFLLTGCSHKESITVNDINKYTENQDLNYSQPDQSEDVKDNNDIYDVSRDKNTTLIVQITDPHFYSPRLHDEGELYNKVMNSAGGRDALHVEEIVDAFVDTMKDIRPDVVIVSGDLTLNGSRASHEDFAAKMQILKDDGIPVFVIPGNHDINNPNCLEIKGYGVYPTPNISPFEFEEIYKDFGFNEAISRDKNSLSYSVNLNDKVTLLMFDSCMYGDNYAVAGNISDETRDWAYKEIKRAKSEGRKVVSVTHQNLVTHNEMFDMDYMVADSEPFVEKLIELGVKVNLSGHMHSMHIANTDNKFYDVALGSLDVFPNYYGKLEITDTTYKFTTASVEHESDSEYYLRTSSPSKSVLSDTAQTRDDLSDDDKLIFDFIEDMHVKYFSGEPIDKEKVKNSKAYELFRNNFSDALLRFYIDMIIETGGNSSRSFEISE